MTEKIKAVLFGVAVGDALGVPAEFSNREELRKNPVTDMIGGAKTAHGQPVGTWSDDSSLTFCLAEALTQKYDLDLIALYFTKWLNRLMWTPWGEIFDIGTATYLAIKQLEDGVRPELAGGNDENSNGNGSLMRILPLLFYLCDKSVEERFRITRQVSSITHRHIRSIVACFYYLEFAKKLLEGKDIFVIYKELQTEISAFLQNIVSAEEMNKFARIFKQNIYELPENEINSTGYVIDTLEASLWCLFNSDSYEKCVLKAVNLGRDTDTTAAVAGGLAGLHYGFKNIPKKWINQLARSEDIMDLCERFGAHCGRQEKR